MERAKLCTPTEWWGQQERDTELTQVLYSDREEGVTAEKKKQMRLVGGAVGWDDEEGSDGEKQITLSRVVIVLDICD